MPIAKSALRAGDLLVYPAPDLAGHVVIFDDRVDETMSSYVGYEQSGDRGTHHRVILYPYFGGYGMSPYRRNCPCSRYTPIATIRRPYATGADRAGLQAVLPRRPSAVP